MNEKYPIEIAPRDGTLIFVWADDYNPGNPYRMRWNPEGFNEIVSLKEGIWEAEDGSFTWCEDRPGIGPTHWSYDI